MTRLPPGASPKLPHTSELRCTCGATTHDRLRPSPWVRLLLALLPAEVAT